MDLFESAVVVECFDNLKKTVVVTGIAIILAILTHAGVTFWALDNLAGWLA